MSGRWKRSVVLLAIAALCVVAGASVATGADSRQLDIYGFGPGDDVANGRADVASKALGSGVNVDNPRGSFNDQAFLTRLASGDVPDVVYMSRDRIAQYAARNALVPLANCFRNESIDTKQYRVAAMKEVTYKNQVYGLPEFTNQITIIVNNDVARQAGVNVADIQTTKWKTLRQVNKKLLKIDNGKLVRIGFDPKLPEFFPMWVKWFGKDLISKDGLKAQLNSKQAVAALAFSYSLIQDHGGWDKFKAFRDTWDFFGAGNQVAKDQIGAWPMESFYYNTLADNSPNVDITAKYFTNAKGGPITMFSGSAWAIPRGAKDADLACKWMKAMTSVDTWKTVAKNRFELRKTQKRAFTSLYTANTAADVKIYEDIYQPMGKKQFDDAVTLLVRAPRYGFAMPSSPAGQQVKQAWTDAVNRVLAGQQTPKQALDQAQREAQSAINKAK